jgi:hypothetical protein
MFLVAAGCAGPPTAEELAAADFGALISQENAESLADAWLDNYLKDPFSAQKRWQPLERGWIREAPIDGGSLIFGYRLAGEINAKNSFGAYTGFKTYIFMIRNGEMVGVYQPSDGRLVKIR